MAGVIRGDVNLTVGIARTESYKIVDSGMDAIVNHINNKNYKVKIGLDTRVKQEWSNKLKETLDSINTKNLTVKIGKISADSAIADFKTKIQGVLSTLSIQNGMSLTISGEQLGTVASAVRQIAASEEEAADKAARMNAVIDEIKTKASTLKSLYKSVTSAGDVDKDTEKLKLLRDKYIEINEEINKLASNKSSFGERADDVDLLRAKIDELTESLKAEQQASKDEAERQKKQKSVLGELTKLYEKYKTLLNSMRDNGLSDTKTYENTEKSAKALEDLIAKVKEGKMSLEELKAINLSELREEFKKSNDGAKELSKTADTLYSKMAKIFENKAAGFILSQAFYKLISLIRNAIDATVELDSALAQIEIVTGLNGQSLEDFTSDAYEVARKVGSDITDVLSTSETYARLGYRDEDINMLSEITSKYANVAATDIDSATSSLTAIMKAFNISASGMDDAASSLVEVGQKYAISASELGEAFQRGGSALSVAGVSLNEAIALFAAGNATVQNAERVGTAFKTMSARIRSSTVELEEMGEEVDSLVASSSDYRAKIIALTSVDGKDGIDIMNTAGEYRSMYDILVDIAGVWDKIDNINQAALLEIIAGKKDQSVLSSVLLNLKDLTGAFEDAENAAGALSDANDIYLKTVEAQMANVSTSFKELSSNIIDSDALSVLAAGLAKALELLAKLTGLAGGFGGTFLGALAAFGAVSTSIGIVDSLLTKLIDTLGEAGKASKALSGISSVISKISTALGALSAGEIAAIAVAIAGIALAISGAIKLYKETHKSLEELRSDLDSVTTQAEEYEGQISSNNARIRELSALKGTADFSIVDANELQDLQIENSYLEAQVALLERRAELMGTGIVSAAIEDAEAIKTSEAIRSGSTGFASVILDPSSDKNYKSRIGHKNGMINSSSVYAGLRYQASSELTRYYGEILQKQAEFETKLSDAQESNDNRAVELYSEMLGNLTLIATETLDALMEKRSEIISVMESLAPDENGAFASTDAASSYNVLSGLLQQIDGYINDMPVNTPEDLSSGFDSAAESVDNATSSISSFAEALFYVAKEDGDTISDMVDKYQTDIGSLGTAMTSLMDGTMTVEDVVDLLQEFPELAGYVDLTADGFGDLKKGIDKTARSRLNNIITELENLRDTVTDSDTRNAISLLIDGLSNSDTIYQMGDAVSDLSDSYYSLSDSVNESREAIDKLNAAMGENPDEGYETRAEAMNQILEQFGTGEIGNASTLWITAEAFGVPDWIINDKNAEALWNWVEARKAWYDTTDEENPISGVNSFLSYVDSVFREYDLSDIGIFAFDGETLDIDIPTENFDRLAGVLQMSKGELEDLFTRAQMFYQFDFQNIEDLKTALINNAETIETSGEAAKNFRTALGQAFDIGDMTGFLDVLNTIVSTFGGSQENLGALSYAIQALAKDKELNMDVVLTVNGKQMTLQEYLDDVLGFGSEYEPKTVEASVVAPDVNGSIDTAEITRVVGEYEKIIADMQRIGVSVNDAIFGNIDTNNRQIIEWTQDNISKYDKALVSWEQKAEEIAGSISTVMGSSANFDGIEIAFSPMLQTANGAVLLDKNTVYEYIWGLIDEAGDGWTSEQLFALDTEGLEFDGVLIKNLLADIGETAKSTGEAMHFTGVDGAYSKVINDLNILASQYGMTVDEMIAQYGTMKSALGEPVETTVDAKMNVDAADAESKIGSLEAAAAGVEGDYQVTIKSNVGVVLSSTLKLKAALNSIKPTKTISIYQTTYETVKTKTSSSTTKPASEVNGTAHAGGSWGAPKTETALVGELGPELVVRGSEWFTVGDGGAEFTNIRKGDIVFNHKQTESLLANGYVAGRGRAIAEGTAYLIGSSSSKKYGTGGYGSASSSATSTASSPSSSSSDDEDAETWFEKWYSYHQYLIATDKETTSDYLNWLNDAYKKAYDEGIIELSDYYNYAEEVYSGLQDMFTDYLSDMEHEADMRSIFVGEAKNIASIYETMITSIEDEINAARAIGLDDSDDYIQSLQSKWKSYKEFIDNLYESTTDDAKDAVKTLVDYRMDMIEKELDDEIELYEDQLDALEEFYDKQRELLDEKYDEEDYLEEQADKRKAVYEIEAELNQLAFDDSAWAQKKRLELQEELSDAKKDLDDFERDHAREQTKAMLDDQEEMQKEAINNSIDELQEMLDNENAIYTQALNDIRNPTEELYNEMMEWNLQYGDHMRETVVDAWTDAKDALNEYYALYGEYYKGFSAESMSFISSKNDGKSWDTTDISGTSAAAAAVQAAKEGASSGSSSSSSSETSYPYGKASSTSGLIASGSTGDSVRAIQYALKSMGYNIGSAGIDGIFGQMTASAVRAFQSDQGIAADGIVGDNTRAKFRAKGYASGTKNATRGFHLFDERGTEAIFTSANGAKYRMFNSGDMVLNADATSFLYDFANSGGKVIERMLSNLIGTIPNNINSTTMANEIRMGDINISGNATEKTVSEIRRAQREQVSDVLKAFQKLNK